MAIDPADLDGSARVAGMIEEFRAAQRRRFVKYRIVWTRPEAATEASHQGTTPEEIPCDVDR